MSVALPNHHLSQTTMGVSCLASHQSPITTTMSTQVHQTITQNTTAQTIPKHLTTSSPRFKDAPLDPTVLPKYDGTNITNSSPHNSSPESKYASHSCSPDSKLPQYCSPETHRSPSEFLTDDISTPPPYPSHSPRHETDSPRFTEPITPSRSPDVTSMSRHDVTSMSRHTVTWHEHVYGPQLKQPTRHTISSILGFAPGERIPISLAGCDRIPLGLGGDRIPLGLSGGEIIALGLSGGEQIPFGLSGGKRLQLSSANELEDFGDHERVSDGDEPLNLSTTRAAVHHQSFDSPSKGDYIIQIPFQLTSIFVYFIYILYLPNIMICRKCIRSDTYTVSDTSKVYFEHCHK